VDWREQVSDEQYGGTRATSTPTRETAA